MNKIEITIPKPKIGEPCNGCGLCCSIQVCMNGAYAMGLVKNLGEVKKGPCPALVSNADNSYSCGIVLNPKKYIKKSKYRPEVLRREFTFLIGAGNGCDDLGLDYDPEEEARLNQMIENIQTPEWAERAKKAIKIIHKIDL